MDLLAIENLIIDYLDGQTGSGVMVYGMPDLDAGSSSRQISPRVDVIYAGYRVMEQRGRSARLRLRWLVVVAVKSVRDIGTGHDARRVAGPLMGQVITAMTGWKPDMLHGAFQLESTGAPIYEAGFLYVPLLFTTTRSIQGAEP